MERQEQQDQQARATSNLKHLEKRLLEERRRAVAQMEQFGDDFRAGEEVDGEQSGWHFHMADEGTDTYEQEQKYLLASREGRLLWNIDQALRRLYRSPDSFGQCADCGNPIGFERLDAIPYVQHCVSCKSAWEGGRAD